MGSVFGAVREEVPRYTLRAARTGYEVREYAPSVAIETVEGGPTGTSKAFGTLAGYIGVRGTPQNEKQAPISMTSPVVFVPGEDVTQQRMQFILPQEEGDAPPAPTHAGVSIAHRPAKLMAVTTFSGSWSHELFTAKRMELVAAIEADAAASGMALKVPLAYEEYRYNPPWTLPFLRTNEVAVEVAAK